MLYRRGTGLRAEPSTPWPGWRSVLLPTVAAGHKLGFFAQESLVSAFRKLYPGDCLAAPSPQRTLPTRSLLWSTSNGGWRNASPGMACGPCGLYSGKPIGAAACGWKAARCSESLPPLVSFVLEMEGHFQELQNLCPWIATRCWTMTRFVVASKVPHYGRMAAF